MPVLRLDADARKGVKEFNDLEKAVAKVDDKLELTTRQAKQLEVAAKRIVDSNLGPQEKYNKRLEDLAKHVKAGTLTMEQAGVQAQKYGKYLNEATVKGEQAFGAGMLGKVAGLVGGLTGVSGVVSAIVGGFKDMDEAAKRAADSVINSLGSVGELQQVSGSQEEFQKNLGFARSLVRRGVFNDLSSAADFTFATTSAGYTDQEKEYLARVGELRQVKGEGLTGFAAGARKVQGLYDGMSLSDVGDRLLAASGLTQANITQTAEAVPALTAMSKALNFNPDEVFAGLVANEEAAPNISEAKTQQRALLAVLLQKNLSTGSLIGSVDSLRQRELGGENLVKLLGSTEAYAGYSSLVSQRGEYDMALKNIQGSAGALGGRNFLGSDLETAAGQMKAKAAGERADSERRYASDQLVFEAVRDELISSSNRRGAGWTSAFRGTTAFLDDWTQNDRNYIKAVLRNFSGELSPELKEGAGSYLLNSASSEGERNEVLSLLRSIAVSVQGTQQNTNVVGGSTRQE